MDIHKLNLEREAHRRNTLAPISTKNMNKFTKTVNGFKKGQLIWLASSDLNTPVKFDSTLAGMFKYTYPHEGQEYDRRAYYYQALRAVTDEEKKELIRDLRNSLSFFESAVK